MQLLDSLPPFSSSCCFPSSAVGKKGRDPDEGIATHIALAFMHFDEFGSDHKIFKKFWNVRDLKRHKDFISFIGRHGLSRDGASDWINYNKIDIEKFKKFWEWAIDNCEVEELAEFGFWINAKCDALGRKWLAATILRTLEKTNGFVEMHYNLINSLVILAKESPKDALAILRYHFLEEIARCRPQRTWFTHMDNEIFNAFKELYSNKETKEDTYDLINDLIREGGRVFWKLEELTQ